MASVRDLFQKNLESKLFRIALQRWLAASSAIGRFLLFNKTTPLYVKGSLLGGKKQRTSVLPALSHPLI